MTSRAFAPRTFSIAVACTGLCVCASSFAVDFATRCNESHVLQCVDFDTAATIAGGYGDRSGTFPGDAVPQIDTSVKASGAGSLRFTIPPNSGANSSGSYFTNFTDDLSVLFGGNGEFYVQWRQRFSSEFATRSFAGGGGWKQIIIGTGDYPGSMFYSSCTALETVVQNTYHRGFGQMYNSCEGSASHGPYDPFEEPFNSFDFKLQNARPAPYCLYSQNGSAAFPPAGNCFGYFADEWMTFQVGITTGPRVGNEFTNSRVRLWIARAGQPSQPVINWGPYNLSAGSAAENQRYGKVWLLPYNTGKSSGTTNPVSYTWYDELIISTMRIPDPDGAVPNPPANVTAN
jgi:hypothetical protein